MVVLYRGGRGSGCEIGKGMGFGGTKRREEGHGSGALRRLVHVKYNVNFLVNVVNFFEGPETFVNSSATLGP